ncbi:tyrosine-type recombinase/integrase [Streptomyces sp. DK15]|uniref:tyrosine-type recombinase/integrase n=1 Tax=Streptomyces sp. DK15 TaxID=2957499 RepID=UPI0029A326E0|nr:tyrosine-type recombinase/integrase [Streptomyces sp. DK15]MDX2388838.1 tyrosine-type recombinase/integrase [Streptomyces sp. DK15]
MGLFGEVERDIDAIRLPQWGRVIETTTVVPFEVVGPEGQAVEAIHGYLRDFTARGRRPGSVRSYAYDLLRWWRWLGVIEVEWDKATSAEVRDFVLWLQRVPKERRVPRTTSAALVGTINPITRKQYPDDQYKVRTVRHSNAVLRSFYEYWIERGLGPLVNPVPLDRAAGRRPNSHHNPLEKFRHEGRLRYNPPIPKRRPRAIPDQRWDELFAALQSDRDRAMVSLAISNAIRAGELLGIRGADVDWGDQLVRVRRKGSGAEQWLPASAEALVWLRLYVDHIGNVGASEPLWWTLRRRRPAGAALERQPLNYDALRAVFRRVNASLGTNWSMHDLRHTCALRMLRDQNLSLRDIQTVLGHLHLSTTQTYLEEEPEEVIRRVHQHLTDRQRADSRPPVPAQGYKVTDLAVLFGEDSR